MKMAKGHFWSVAKVALRFGCAKQSKNLKMCPMHRHWLQTAPYVHSRGNMTVLCLIILLSIIQLNHKFYGNLATEA